MAPRNDDKRDITAVHGKSSKLQLSPKIAVHALINLRINGDAVAIVG